MQENKSKAIKAAIIAFLCLTVLVFGIDIIMNLIDGKPAFTMPKAITIIINIAIVAFGTFSVARNVYNGKKWYK